MYTVIASNMLHLNVDSTMNKEVVNIYKFLACFDNNKKVLTLNFIYEKGIKSER